MVNSVTKRVKLARDISGFLCRTKGETKMPFLRHSDGKHALGLVGGQMTTVRT